MFASLRSKFSKIFDNLSHQAVISDNNIKDAIAEIRDILIDADVALEVVNSFIDQVQSSAIGHKIVKSVSAKQTFIKILHTALKDILSCSQNISFTSSSATLEVMLVGIQGNGKTTTCAKLAKYFSNKGKKCLLISFDIHRFAAQEQLNALAKSIGIDYIEYSSGDTIHTIYNKVEKIKHKYQIIFYDTAGRNQADNIMMQELKEIHHLIDPKIKLLVVDAMMGQNAVNLAQLFNDNIDISSIVLSKVDSDTRAGAALSLVHTIKKPISFIGVGENVDGIETFDANQMASRILDLGDIVGLVEKAEQVVGKEELEKEQNKLMQGDFSLQDYMRYMKTIAKIGGMANILKFLPGMGRVMSASEDKINNFDNKLLKRHIAIISSMTPEERQNLSILNFSRKKRIALGSGTHVSDINFLINQYRQIKTLFKNIKNNPMGISGIMNMIKKGR